MSISQRVKQIIVEQLGVDAAEVTPQANFVNDLGADSLDALEIVMTIEEEFDIRIEDAEARKVVFVQDIVDFVENKVKGSD